MNILPRPGQALLIVTVLLLSSAEALACRCAEVGLEEHYKLADSVLFMKIVGTRETHVPRQGIQVLVEPLGEPYKGNPGRIHNFFTGRTSAACGIRPQPGSHWLFFVQHDPDFPGVGHVHSCNGTRSFDPNAADGLQGFPDTPADQVIQALTALREGKQPPRARGIIVEKPVGGLPTQFSVIGLLEMPRLLEPHRFDTAERETFQPVPVYTAPAVGANVITRLSPEDELPTAEFSYERPGAIVHQTQPGWYRIALPEEAGVPSGWVQSSDAHAYWPIEKLLPNALSYLTRYWDGLVWPEPGAGLPHRFPERFRDPDNEQPVEILDLTRVADSLWWQVEVQYESVCNGRGRPRVVSRGWVPAFDENGRNTAWFFSRGC